MGKSSKSKSKSSTTNRMGNVNLSNPFLNTTVNKNGDVNTSFADGSAYNTNVDFVDNNIGWLRDNYLRPSLNNPTDQAKLAQFNKTLGETGRTTLQNNILNPLISNNMVRSSQATNMYNNMYNQMNDSIADYTNNLLANSQENTGNMINTLMGLYNSAYQGLSSAQNTAINAALGNNTTSTNSNSNAK